MRKQLLCAAMLVTGLAGVAQADAILSGPFTDPFKPGDNIYVTSRDTWTGAEAFAQSLGGNLMSINSAGENAWVVSNILTTMPENFGIPNVNSIGTINLTSVPLWIGFSDPTPGDGTGSQHAADFQWADGSSVAYTNWNAPTGEPNNDPTDGNGSTPNGDRNPAGVGNGEYYTAINWHFAQGGSNVQGTWNDTPNDGTLGFGGNSDGQEGDFHGYLGIVEVPINPVPLPATGWAGLGLMSLLAAAKLAKHNQNA